RPTDRAAGTRREQRAAVEDGAIPEGHFPASQRPSPPLAARDTGQAMPEIRPWAHSYVNAYDKTDDKRYTRQSGASEKVTGQVRRSDGWFYLGAQTVARRAARSAAREPDTRTDRQRERQAT